MKIRNSILGILLSALLISSCVGDLNVTPLDKDVLLAGVVADDPELLKQFLGKTYASFIIAGQGANGGADITGGDENFFTTMRAYWNLQEITTDEAMCAWSDVGIADLNTQTWSPSNPFLTALYQRLALSITFANEFIRLTSESTEPEFIVYNAEARFLRAMAYSYAIDLFGQFPFTTEEDGIGKDFPNIGSREEIFNYVEIELLEIQDLLGEPGSSYPQADKAAAWMLLAKNYLNAEVYTGTARWEDCKTYCDKVEASGAYSLNPNYRQNFTADNHYPANSEMIFAWEQDGINTQGWLGTTFIIQSSCDPLYIPSPRFHGISVNPNWNGNRTRRDFLEVLLDTLTLYSGGPVPETDSFFSTTDDSRVYLKLKESLSIPTSTSSGNFGIGVMKFTALNADGTEPATFSTSFACTDYPVFRYADAIMMRAEANYRLGDAGSAATDINAIRERAFGDASHNVGAGDVNDKLILDERGREFYYEGQRRTDLVRFGKFTGGEYTWTWKGGAYEGASTESHRDLFPIPGDELSANPELQWTKQSRILKFNMMKNKIIFPLIIALISITISCDKEEDRVIMGDVAPPELISTPTLELKRANADDTLVFVGTPIDPGFQASVKYLMRVRPAGDASAKLSSIYSSSQDTLIKMTVSELNGYVKSKAKPWIPTALDFIIQADLNSSAGRGAEVFSYISAPVAIMVTTYGDPMLDLIDSGSEQSLETYEEGDYSDLVDLLNANPFTLYNPETGLTYGGSNGALALNGPAIIPPADGEYNVIVNLDAMTYQLIRNSAAIMDVIGSGTDQSLTSPLGDGIYSGLILVGPDAPFTFEELDTKTSYGGSGGVLAADGAAISVETAGWHMATVDVNDLTYEVSPYSVAVVGAFTDWGNLPDIPMDYDPGEGFWFVTLDLPVGPMKFRLNSAWDIRWGPGVLTDLPENGGTMVLPNSDADINITAAGNYSIELTIFTETTGSAKFTLN